ncbi:MAG: hypothetical protein ABSC92_17910 [Rhizomicrobium sp.]|jgi:hypothetical protein
MGLALLCAIASPAVAQGLNVLHPDGPYTQAATGMTYPISVGDFQRLSIIRYKSDGTDESVGYNQSTPGSEIVATVYMFPSPSLTSIFSPQSVVDDARNSLCNSQFHAVQQEIVSAHPDSVLKSEGAAILTQGSAVYTGHQASYILTHATFLGRMKGLARSDVYLFCYAGGKWSVEYRIDYPVDFDASIAIANFMRDLTWTIPPEK